MYTVTKLSTFISVLGIIKSTYLDAVVNYRSNSERNNILNKSLWIRKKLQPVGSSDFVFNANYLETDNLLQDNGIFNPSNIKSSPFFSSYVDRNKRSIPHQQLKHRRKGLNRCKDKTCLNTTEDDVIKIKISNLPSTIEPSNSFEPYNTSAPIEKASLNINNDTTDFNHFDQMNLLNENNTSKSLNETINDNDYNNINIVSNATNNNTYYISSKEYKSEIVENVKSSETKTNTEHNVLHEAYENNGKTTRHRKGIPVHIRYNSTRNQSQHVNMSKPKPLTEKGILKVFTMLRKTFRRIVRQHNEIKSIHNKMYKLNNDFMSHLEILTDKIKEFDSKYNRIVKINEDFNQREKNVNDKRNNFFIKENALSNQLKEFEKIQNKFLEQQQQFYNVQKQLLQKNDQISLKQSQIAKAQNEISQRQNYFARILKKIQQVYNNVEHNAPIKMNNNNTDIKTEEQYLPKSVTTSTPQTESIKINLFSIPPQIKELPNHDKEILKEKDNQRIDDLVYKYYFNNTFIDDIIKNKILANLIASDSNHITKKRKPRKKYENTVLIPVNNNNNLAESNRVRRWIKRTKNKIHKKENLITLSENAKRAKMIKGGNKEKYNTDPFLKMAMTFCTEVGQAQTIQIFNWCVEKALRRLQVLESKMSPVKSVTGSDIKIKSYTKKKPITESTKQTSSTVRTQSSPLITSPSSTPSNGQPITTESINYAAFFPDNDELEVNLKQYELTPDTEGNIYYDGSLHASDINIHDHQDSEGFSDIVPGLDSNSRAEVDPVAIDLQAHRRAEVRRINEKIMRVKMA